MTPPPLFPSARYGLLVAIAITMTQLIVTTEAGKALNKYILDYEPLEFDHGTLQNWHDRVRRDIDTHLKWKFQAYGKFFRLQLQPAESVFAPDHVMVFGSEPPTSVDTSFVYEGYLEDHPGSSAHLSILPGRVSGHIRVPEDTTYHIEPARNYFEGAEFHTIIYPESKMNMDPFNNEATSLCGIETAFKRNPNSSSTANIKNNAFDHNIPHGRLLSPSQPNTPAQDAKSRYRRQAGNLLNANQNRCLLSLQVDKLLYDRALARQTATADLSKAQQARQLLVTLTIEHVTELNRIYKDAEFYATGDPSKYYKGINFQIKKFTIITECETAPNQWEAGYCVNNLDVSHFLQLTAMRNQDSYCLTYTLTFRDFLNGVQGLAYVGLPGASQSGVCGRYAQARNADGAVVSMSLNTGIVSFVNHGQEVPPAVSHLTFAHEIGHNFGALHDPDTEECSPGGSQGNYLMFAMASRGALSNNYLFSNCSKDSIFKVLNSFDGSTKTDCFTSPDSAICGNAVVEDGEECDCGYEEDCARVDKCCVPRNADGTQGCTKQPSAVCSPTSGPCCGDSCTYLTNTVLCREGTDCMTAAYCDASSSACPVSKEAEDYAVFCGNFTYTCLRGQCIGSLCKKIGWEDCYKTIAEGATQEELCYVSCRNGSDGECVSTLDSSLFDLILGDKRTEAKPDGSTGIRRESGSSCNDQRGYCDILAICQNYDSEGPYKRLLGNFLDSSDWNHFRDWSEDHWWVIALACAGGMVLLGLFVKLTSYHTPPYDPSKPRPPKNKHLDSLDDDHMLERSGYELRHPARKPRGDNHRPGGAAVTRDRHKREETAKHGAQQKSGKMSRQENGGNPMEDLERGDNQRHGQQHRSRLREKYVNSQENQNRSELFRPPRRSGHHRRDGNREGENTEEVQERSELILRPPESGKHHKRKGNHHNGNANGKREQSELILRPPRDSKHQKAKSNKNGKRENSPMSKSRPRRSDSPDYFPNSDYPRNDRGKPQHQYDNEVYQQFDDLDSRFSLKPSSYSPGRSNARPSSYEPNSPFSITSSPGHASLFDQYYQSPPNIERPPPYVNLYRRPEDEPKEMPSTFLPNGASQPYSKNFF